MSYKKYEADNIENIFSKFCEKTAGGVWFLCIGAFTHVFYLYLSNEVSGTIAAERFWRIVAIGMMFVLYEIYRKKVLVLLPEGNALHFFTFVLMASLTVIGVLCIYSDQLNERAKEWWILFLAANTFLLFTRTLTARVLLARAHPESPLVPYFTQWVLKCVGYTILLLLLAPIVAALKKSPPMDVFIVSDYPWYVDAAVSAAVASGVVISLWRHARIREQLIKSQI